jgi:quinol monooxygenase YgiN
MIAQVFRGQWTSDRAPDEAVQARGNDLAAQVSNADGCEQIMVLVDPATNGSLVINVWRDREAMEKYRSEVQPELIEQAGSDVDLVSEDFYEVQFRS